MIHSRVPYRWRVVALLFLLSALNYLDRQTLSMLAPTLRVRLGFSAVEYSYIVSSFLVAYMLAYFFCGAVVDRLGVRTSVTLALAVWSLAGMLHAFVATWIGLLVCRFLLGLGESFNTPCGIKAITEWIPRRERGLSIAIFSNGNTAGAIIAPPLVSFVALKYGWQWGFLVTGGLGLVYLVFWLAYYDSPEKQRRLGAAERAMLLADRRAEPAASAISFLAAIRQPACIGFVIARLFTDSLSYFFNFWLPEYLHTAHGFTLGMIGLFSWIPFLAAGIGGPGGGALSDWMVRRGGTAPAARRRLLLGAACLMPLAVAAVHVSSAALALGLIALLLAAQSCWNSNLLAMISEVFPREQVATFVALSGIGGALGGVLSTLLAGRTIAAVGYVPVFTTLGFLHLTAYGVLSLCLRFHPAPRILASPVSGQN